MNNQIEEMAKDIYWCKSCDTSFEENCKLLAYDLVTLGYQKIDKDNVVLSREEWECLHNDYAKALYNARQNERKETAREIFNELKKKGAIHTEFDWNDYLEIDIDDLKELAKQYGVEIKE